MEEFINNMRIVLGSLGHKVLEPLKAVFKNDEQGNEATIAGIPLTFSLKNLTKLMVKLLMTVFC